MDLNKKYLKLIEDSIQQIDHNDKSILNKFRSEGKNIFSKQGLPSNTDENWIYTDLKPAFEKKWNFITQTPEIDINYDKIFRWDIPKFDSHLILLFNGYCPDSNSINDLHNEIIIGSLAKLSAKYPEMVEKYLFKSADIQGKFEAINAALAIDGVFVYIPKNVRLTKPLQIINITCGNESYFINQHNLIVLEHGSSAQIVFQDLTYSPSPFLINQLSEIHLEQGAELDFYNIQNQHNDAVCYSSINVTQNSNSNFHSNTVTLHSGTIRNQMNVKLIEQGAICELLGINLTDGNQHVDNNTTVEHLAPNCHSNQLFKGIYDNNATGSFTGKITVHTDSQKTVAYQSNKNMLLSSGARVNTRPQLEIYADDVKCSHGATTGQLDPNMLFYLRTRGIDLYEARMLLMYAFSNEIISKIKIEHLQKHIEGLINRRLRGELSKCKNCVIKCGLQ